MPSLLILKSRHQVLVKVSWIVNLVSWTLFRLLKSTMTTTTTLIRRFCRVLCLPFEPRSCYKQEKHWQPKYQKRAAVFKIKVLVRVLSIDAEEFGPAETLDKEITFYLFLLSFYKQLATVGIFKLHICRFRLKPIIQTNYRPIDCSIMLFLMAFLDDAIENCSYCW